MRSEFMPEARSGMAANCEARMWFIRLIGSWGIEGAIREGVRPVSWRRSACSWPLGVLGLRFDGEVPDEDLRRRRGLVNLGIVSAWALKYTLCCAFIVLDSLASVVGS